MACPGLTTTIRLILIPCREKSKILRKKLDKDKDNTYISYNSEISEYTDNTIEDDMTDKNKSCCAVEAIITVDERGQMVLPKDFRAKAGIKAGDKFAVTAWEKDGKVCCFALVNVREISGIVNDMLGDVMKGS